MSKLQFSDAPDLRRRRALGGLGAALGGMMLPGFLRTAGAQEAGYPAKPVRVLLGYSPGGTADVMTRLVSDSLQQGLKQPFVVENRPGASGNIAAQIAAQAGPDGYTLLFGNPAEIAINKLMMADMSFDPQADFVPIVRVFNVPLALVVPAASPFNSLKDLLDGASATKGKYFFASAGSGSPGHLAAESLALQTGASLTHVPYKGAGPALTDLIGGHVDCYFAGLTAVAPHLKAGAIKVLAVSSIARSPMMPEVPTVAELGTPDFDFTLWGGLFARTGTDGRIVAKLNEVANAAFDRQEVKDRMMAEYSEVAKNTPEEFQSFIQRQIEKYRKIIKTVGIEA